MERNAKRAVDELAATAVDVIAYACLSTSLAKGLGWSESFIEDVHRATRLPATTAATATMDALRALGVKFGNWRLPGFHRRHRETLLRSTVPRRIGETSTSRTRGRLAYRSRSITDWAGCGREAQAVCLLATDIQHAGYC
jgi:hypothetical protein